MTELAVLTADEADILADCEETISHHLQTFVEVGTALTLIRDNRLYRATHGTFEAYVADRWGIVDSRARQLIIAAQTVTTVTAAGLPAPANERQARELARVPEPERAEVWRAANDATDGRPTAAAIRAAAQPTETAVGADISPTDASGEGADLSVPAVAVAASPESEGKSGSGEVTPDLDPDESHREWLRQFAERATAVREGRESFVTFAADFPPDAMAICAGPYEHGLMAALQASQAPDPIAVALAEARAKREEVEQHNAWVRELDEQTSPEVKAYSADLGRRVAPIISIAMACEFFLERVQNVDPELAIKEAPEQLLGKLATVPDVLAFIARVADALKPTGDTE